MTKLHSNWTFLKLKNLIGECLIPHRHIPHSHSEEKNHSFINFIKKKKKETKKKVKTRYLCNLLMITNLFKSVWVYIICGLSMLSTFTFIRKKIILQLSASIIQLQGDWYSTSSWTFLIDKVLQSAWSFWVKHLSRFWMNR